LIVPGHIGAGLRGLFVLSDRHVFGAFGSAWKEFLSWLYSALYLEDESFGSVYAVGILFVYLDAVSAYLPDGVLHIIDLEADVIESSAAYPRREEDRQDDFWPPVLVRCGCRITDARDVAAAPVERVEGV
jgi:hypothetical protein